MEPLTFAELYVMYREYIDMHPDERSWGFEIWLQGFMESGWLLVTAPDNI